MGGGGGGEEQREEGIVAEMCIYTLETLKRILACIEPELNLLQTVKFGDHTLGCVHMQPTVHICA